MKNKNPGHAITDITICAYSDSGSIFVSFIRGTYINKDGSKAMNTTTHSWRMSNASVMRATRAALILRDMQKVKK